MICSSEAVLEVSAASLAEERVTLGGMSEKHM